MQWLLAFHIIAVVCWFAGLFYLPRLFVYHADVRDEISNQRFKIMEQRLYYGIMTPAAILTILFGIGLLSMNFKVYLAMVWLQIKLILVLFLLVYHIYCGFIIQRFKLNSNNLSSKFFRFFNEIPTLLLIAIVILAVVQPS